MESTRAETPFPATPSSYPTWKQSRTKHLAYSRRVPEQTVLYRVIYHHRQAVGHHISKPSPEQYIFDALVAEGLLSNDVVSSMQSWEHSGFSVFSAEPIEADDQQTRLFVARYLKKSPIALDRLSIDESTNKPEIVCSRKCDDGVDSRAFSPLEFLAEISQHIPDTWEQTTRYYGCYAARSRKLLEQTKEALSETELTAATDPTPTKPASKYWARWIKKVYEVDPLVCRKCGSEMKIVAFIHKTSEIEKISAHLGLQPYRAPPPIRTQKQHQYCEPDFDHLQFAELD